MINFLDNGAVLPFGLLGDSPDIDLAGFNKNYNNTPLRAGIIVESYPKNHENNKSKLSTEYDVIVFEQNVDQGVTPIRYRNCLASESLGSIADFFEHSLRKPKNIPSVGGAVATKGHDAPVALLLCLDGFSEKAIIIGALTHPDRQTTIKDSDPHLEGEYNGVRVKITKDGGCSITIKGATNNDGKVINNNGQVKISVTPNKDISIESSGNINLIVKQDANITIEKDAMISCQNASITAAKNITATCIEALISASGTATIEGKEVELGEDAPEAVVKGDTFKKLFDEHIHIGNLGANTTPPLFPLEVSALSRKVKTE